MTAGDGSGSYSVDTEASFEFVGAFDLRPAESVNLWPQRGNITIEVLRARRPITAVVPEEAASWGLYATPSPEEGDKRFTGTTVLRLARAFPIADCCVAIGVPSGCGPGGLARRVWQAAG